MIHLKPYKLFESNNKFVIFDLIDNNDIDGINNYIKNGGDINVLDINMMTSPSGSSMKFYSQIPLIHAVISDKIDIIRLLIKNGVDINKKNQETDTALNKACEFDLFEITKLLLENGADINTVNRFGETPLLWTLDSNNDDLLILLIKNNVDWESDEGFIYEIEKNNNKKLINIVKKYSKTKYENYLKNKKINDFNL